MELPVTPKVDTSASVLKRAPTTPLTPSLAHGNAFKRSNLDKSNAKVFDIRELSEKGLRASSSSHARLSLNDEVQSQVQSQLQIHQQLRALEMQKQNWLKDQKINRLQEDLKFLELEKQFGIQ